MSVSRYLFIAICLVSLPHIAGAQEKQDGHGQYPFLLSNAYLGVHVGYIHYPFTNALPEPGFSATEIKIPATSLRIVFGHQFNRHFSAQISYMRPINWVEYRNVNGDSGQHAVFTNVAGLTGKVTLPVFKKLSVFGEGGMSIVTRSGFSKHDTLVVSSANYISYQLSGGLNYLLNKRWDLAANFTYAAGNKAEKQPYTIFAGLGLIYHMQPLSEKAVAHNNSGGYIFPRNMLQLGVASNILGYGVNDYFTKRPIPIFWDGGIDVRRGLSLQYEQNAFHGRRFFSLEWGANVSVWESNINREIFFTASIFPLFRFIPLRTKPFDLYFNYALAGPSFISQRVIDNINSGEHFTFYDFMGLGTFVGKRRNMNAELRIAHYSNGNLFYHNPGLTVPLTLNVGYTF